MLLLLLSQGFLYHLCAYNGVICFCDDSAEGAVLLVEQSCLHINIKRITFILKSHPVWFWWDSPWLAPRNMLKDAITRQDESGWPQTPGCIWAAFRVAHEMGVMGEGLENPFPTPLTNTHDTVCHPEGTGGQMSASFFILLCDPWYRVHHRGL